MNLSFKEQFERAVQTPAAPRTYSGSPARFELRWERDFTNTIDAIKALRDCGLTLHDAKEKIEELMARRVLVVDLPFVPDADALIARIERDGAMAKLLAPLPANERPTASRTPPPGSAPSAPDTARPSAWAPG